ncbi:cell division protein FtsK, partial [Streptomyces mirabilis]
MKHPDDDNELFNRLEAEMTDPAAPSGGEVVDLGKARTARGESPDPTPDPSADSRPSKSADPEPTESADGPPTLVDQKVPTVSGPGVIDRIKNSKRLDVFPAWLKSGAEFKEAFGWLAGHAWHTVAFHAVRVPFVYLP